MKLFLMLFLVSVTSWCFELGYIDLIHVIDYEINEIYQMEIIVKGDTYFCVQANNYYKRDITIKHNGIEFHCYEVKKRL